MPPQNCLAMLYRRGNVEELLDIQNMTVVLSSYESSVSHSNDLDTDDTSAMVEEDLIVLFPANEVKSASSEIDEAFISEDGSLSYDFHQEGLVSPPGIQWSAW